MQVTKQQSELDMEQLDWFQIGKEYLKAVYCRPAYLTSMQNTSCKMLSFKPTFSLSTFTFIKRLLSSSSLSAIRVVSSAYLRLLIIFLPEILIQACASSSPAFLMMYSA